MKYHITYHICTVPINIMSMILVQQQCVCELPCISCFHMFSMFRNSFPKETPKASKNYLRNRGAITLMPSDDVHTHHKRSTSASGQKGAG